MNSRRLLLSNITDYNYISNGLKIHIDAIKNKNETTLIDQTGNYIPNLIEGQFVTIDNYIYLKNTRFLIPCGDLLQNSFTISVTYKKLTDKMGMIWSLAEPSQSLTGLLAAGHKTDNIEYWSAGSWRNTRFKANDSSPHEVTVLFNFSDQRAQIYQDGEIAVTYSGEVFRFNENLKLIIGGFMDSDKRMENANLYELRVYNRLLTPQEIKYNYKVDRMRYGI